MKHTQRWTLLPGAALLCAALLSGTPAAAQHAAPPVVGRSALPPDSLYWLNVPLTDTLGRAFALRDLAGHPLLVTMFYGDCNTACPIVLENLTQTMNAVNAPAGALSVLMVSLDPVHDTPASLARLVQSHNLDAKRFRVAVSKDETNTRAMAAALNIKYRAVAGGEISHTTRICLLDANGKVLASSTQLSATPDPEFVKNIRLALK